MAGEVLPMGPGTEVWLPSDFLADDLFFHKHQQQQESKKSGAVSPVALGFTTELAYDYLSSEYSCSSSSSSNPSSPVESATESEDQSDDDLDEYLAGLTTQMAHSFLQEADEDAAGADKKKVACSPPSPVCTSGADPSLDATLREVPKPPSTPSPPPAEAPGNDDTALDALYAAGGQGMPGMMGSIVFGGLSFPVGLPQALDGRDDACSGLGNYYYQYRKPAFGQHQLQVAQQLKHQQLVNQQLAAAAAWRQQKSGSPGAAGCPHHLPLGLPSSAWPSLQPPAVGKAQHSIGVGVVPPPGSCSGMRAVFLPGGLGQKPSTGTGVFLPRRAGSPTQTRWKPGCSTVLMPARVVHALNNLNIEAAGETQPAGYCGGAVVGRVPRRRPLQLHGGCVGVGRSADADTRAGGNGGGAGAVASYSSLVDGGGGRGSRGRGASANNDYNNKKTGRCGGDLLRLAVSRGRRFAPQEQQQQAPPPPSPSPETRLPPEWIY